ncbi:MAG: hypothetical protein ACHQNA_14885, partial [Acidimicrobiales bacterium]
LYAMVSNPSTAPNVLLLYDRLWEGSGVAHSTTGNQAISGTPTRYSTSGTAQGNFIFLEVFSTLGTTAHNVSFNYTDDQGNARTGATVQAVVVSSTAGRIPITPNPFYFWPINGGDRGVQAITRVVLSAVSSGTSNAVLGHPIAFIPQPVANSMVVMEGVGSALGLVPIAAGAALAFLEIKGVASATTYAGMATVASG